METAIPTTSIAVYLSEERTEQALPRPTYGLTRRRRAGRDHRTGSKYLHDTCAEAQEYANHLEPEVEKLDRERIALLSDIVACLSRIVDVILSD